MSSKKNKVHAYPRSTNASSPTHPHVIPLVHWNRKSRIPFLIGEEELINAYPCFAGNAFKHRRGRGVDTVHEIRNRRLGEPNIRCKGGLADPVFIEVDSESFHVGSCWLVMRTESIGFAYSSAIGRTYSWSPQNSGMPKSTERSFLDRAMEALGERYPREKPTQKRLAQLAGVKQPSVYEWSEPSRYPKIATGVRLAKALGVCVEWLYTEHGPKRPGAAGAPDEHLSPILEAWPDLAPELRRQVARYTDFVKGDTKD